MVTKKTRLMSGLVAVLMLVSMFTAFVVPVSAETAATNYDEVAGTALVDKSGLENINKGFVSGVKEYQVTDRAGVEVIAHSFDKTGNSSVNELNNYKFYQMADIDMGWEPFEGIAGYNDDASATSFRGNWDGNGFVIKNLYVNHADSQKDLMTGFFNRLYSNGDHHTIQNFGIASGIVIGRGKVGSIAGDVNGNNASTHSVFINCWSAATVVGIGTDGVAGLVGNMNGSKMTKDFGLYNCAFYGTVYSSISNVAGLLGWETSLASFQMKNCYMGGELIAGANSTYCKTYVDSADAAQVYAALGEVHGYNAFLRADATSTLYKAENFSNNYYLKSCGQKSYADALNDFDGVVNKITDEATGTETYSKGSSLALNDNGKGVDSAADLAASLNEGITNNTGTGYTVKYSDSTAGYPVLTYYNSENEVIAKRLPADDGFVASKNSLTTKSTLLKDVAALQKGGVAVDGKSLENLEVATANDLMALCLVTVGTDTRIYTSGKILFSADIDASKQTIIPGFPYYPGISAGANLNVSVDGQNHVIYNYHNYAMKVSTEPTGGLIYRLGNANISNLGMVNAKASFDNAASWKDATGYAHPSLMVQQTVEDAVINMTNCFAIGDIYLFATNDEICNENDFGGLIGCIRRGTGTVNISNCWADTTVHRANGNTQKARAIGTVATLSGSTPAATVNWKNVTYIASKLPFSSGTIADGNTSIDLTCQPYLDVEDSSNRYLAAYMNSNNTALENITAALWTVEECDVTGKTITTFGDENNAICTVAAVKDFGSGTESIETYLMVGEKYTVSEIANYSLKEGSGYTIGQEITVANQDYAIPYVLTGVETKPAEDIVADLGRYDMTLFVNNGADMAAVLADAEAALMKAEEALKSEDPARIKAANDAVQAAWTNYQTNVTAEDRVLKGVWPDLPGYADIDIYKALEGYDAKNLAISDRADWIAAVKEGAKTFEGITLHLTDHIDMENDATDLKPLSFGNTFKGTLDGHSYAFTNVKMEFVATAERNDTGLISRLDSPGVVKDLGIAKGTMTFDYSSTSGDDIGFAALVGRMNGGGTILRCWNAADVTVTASGGKTNVSVAGIAGRGHQGSVIDGCYNLGTITAPNHASGINDWGQSTNQNGVAGKIFNSFNAGTLVAPGSKALVRYNNFSSAEDALAVQKNSYSLGYPYASDSTTKDAFNKAPYSEMDPAAYASGELAWYLNTGYQEGYGEKTYWTIKGGETVYGTAANQTVRVVLNFENREDEYVYLNMDDATAELSITYGEDEGNNKPIFKVAEGYKSTIAEGSSTLTYNAEDGDVEVNVTFDGDGIDYINYLKAIEAWGARNSDYFKPNAAGRTLATVVAEARALHKAADATQETVDALAAELVAFGSNYVGYPNLPTISEYEAYSDAPGYLIKTVAELEMAGADAAKYTAAQTLYLANDLDLKDGTSFIGFVDLKASFDGCGNTISNLEITEDVPAFGFFHHFRGASVKNLTLDNVHNRGAYGRAVLVADYYGSGDLTIENVHLLNCSSTATISAHQGGINAMGTLLSRMNSGGNVTVANCTVVGTKLLSEIPDDNTTDGLGNIGLIIGQVSGNRTFNVTNVLLKDSEMGVNCTFATGIAFGCVEGKAVLNLENVGIINNKRTGYSPNWNCGVVAGMVKDGGKVAMNNMVIYGNDNGTTGYVYDKAFNVYDHSNDAYDGVLNQEGWSNVYADLARITQRTDIDDGSASNGNMMNITAEQLPMIAYTINASGVTQKWDVTEGVISFDTDGKGLPVKVEFALKEVDYETLGDISATVYTDADGMPVGLTDETVEALKEKAYWADDVDWDGPYEEDTAVTGIPYPAHDESHETRLVPDADGIHHYTVCNYVAEEVAPCGYKSELAECEFEYVSTAVEGTKPEDAKHKQVCACGNERAEVACDDGGENFTVTTVPATPEAEGSVTSECKLCGYTHVKTLIKLVGITIDADGAYAGESGEVLVKLNNNPGLSGAVVKITYDSDLMTLKDAVLLLPASIPGGENGQQVQEYTTDADADGMVTTTITFAIYGNHDQEDLLKLTFDYSADAVAEDDLSVKAPLKIEVPDVSTFDLESFDVTPYVDGVEIFDIVYGDIDDDKAVTIRDAILMLRHINGDPDLETVEPNLNLVAADIDADSVIEIAEVITVLQYLNHFIDAITRG